MAVIYCLWQPKRQNHPLWQVAFQNCKLYVHISHCWNSGFYRMRAAQNGQHFAEGIFMNFLEWNAWILDKVSFEYVHVDISRWKLIIVGSGNSLALKIEKKMAITLQWRPNGHDGVSNHQPHHCLLSRLFGRRSKKTSKLRVTGLCAGNSPGTDEFPAQMASNAENVSIWWRHHDLIHIWLNPFVKVCFTSLNESTGCPTLRKYTHVRNFSNTQYLLKCISVFWLQICTYLIKRNKLLKAEVVTAWVLYHETRDIQSTACPWSWLQGQAVDCISQVYGEILTVHISTSLYIMSDITTKCRWQAVYHLQQLGCLHI